MKDEYIIACVETLTVWNFYPSKEDADNALPQVQARYLKDAENCQDNHAKYGADWGYPRDPNREDYWLKQSAKYKLQAETSKVMTYKEYEAAQADKLLCEPLQEITEERFDYALNVLPPMKWGNNRGVYSFFMSEFQTGNYTHQYAQMSGKFWVKLIDYRRPETWIQPEMIKTAVLLETV